MTTAVSRRPADVFRRSGHTQRTAVTRIVRRIESATESQLTRGQEWYAEAFEFASLLSAASGHDIVRCAAVIAHLSPKTQWYPNVSFATALLLGDRTRHPGQLQRNLGKALRALDSDDPLSTFNHTGEGDGLKTAAFVRNILGDTDAVTVDVWASRVVGVTEAELTRAGMYGACSHAYRLAAGRLGMTPRDTQATAWVHITDQRAAYRATR